MFCMLDVLHYANLSKCKDKWSRSCLPGIHNRIKKIKKYTINYPKRQSKHDGETQFSEMSFNQVCTTGNVSQVINALTQHLQSIGVNQSGIPSWQTPFTNHGGRGELTLPWWYVKRSSWKGRSVRVL